MAEKNATISPTTMKMSESRPRQLPQYLAGISATMGALSLGLAIGWSSPAGEDGAELKYDFGITPAEFSWLTSVLNLGAAAVSIPSGMLANWMGRRRLMLATSFTYTVAWACIIWPNSVATLVFGRFLNGFSSGVFSVTAPTYTGEIADKNTRGRLGNYLELNVVLGILLAYVLSLLHSMFLLSLVSASVPLIFFAIFFWMPESPTYYLMKGDEVSARKTLVWLRGEHYDVQPELEEQKEAIDEAKRNKVSFLVAIRSRAALKGLFIGYGLMFFQQMSGVNAIIFYGSTIIDEATGEKSDWPMIVVGALQVVAVVLSILIVDSFGRRFLLFISGSVMCITSFVMGVYFYLDTEHVISVEHFKWLPLLCISGFVLAIEMGFGPIPWMMVGEIFSPQVKGIAASSACLLNWMLAFIVTRFFGDVQDALGPGFTFWLFSAICALSIVFVFFVVPETKGKTLLEIQVELEGSSGKKKAQQNAGHVIKY